MKNETENEINTDASAAGAAAAASAAATVATTVKTMVLKPRQQKKQQQQLQQKHPCQFHFYFHVSFFILILILILCHLILARRWPSPAPGINLGPCRNRPMARAEAIPGQQPIPRRAQASYGAPNNFTQSKKKSRELLVTSAFAHFLKKTSENTKKEKEKFQPNISEILRKCPNASEGIRMHPNASARSWVLHCLVLWRGPRKVVPRSG